MLPEDISTSTVLAVTKGVLGWYTVAVQQTFLCGCVSICVFRTETYLDVISTSALRCVLRVHLLHCKLSVELMHRLP